MNALEKYRQGPRPLRLTTLAATLLPLAMLSACGGGSGSSTPPPAAAQVSGTVATGNFVSNAAVTATDTHGKTVTAISDSNGHYTLVTASLTAPIALVATDPTGQSSNLVSVLTALPAAGQSATANINTLTTAIAALLTPDGNPMDLVAAGSTTTIGGAVTSTNVKNATATLDAYLANLLSATGLPASYDPIGTPYPTTAHTTADNLVDMVSIVPEGSVTYLIYNTPLPSSATTQSNTYLALNNTSTPSNTPVVPAVTAAYVANYASLQNYLSGLPTALKPCAAAGGTGSACNGVIDANYKDNGFTNITAYDSNLTSSNLSFTSSNPYVVNTNANGTSALVAIPYALVSSTTQNSLGQYALYTTVQQTPSGSWDIIGNQLPYNLSATTRTTYRQFLDTFTDPNTGRPDTNFFDAGLTLAIGSMGSGESGAALYFAHVTGPGLPAAGLWLGRYNATLSMLLVSTPPAAPLTSPPTPASLSGTNEYRWSWAPSTYQPPTAREFWATTPIDVTQAQAGSVYQFTLYDINGNNLGTYSVTNPNNAVDATLGQSYYQANAFPVLGNGDFVTGVQCPGVLSGAGSSDPAANFLCPTGSLAAQQTSLTMNFTPPSATAKVPSPLTETGALIQTWDRAGCNVQEPVSFGPTTTSATISAAGTCANGTPYAFWAINNPSGDATFRQLQLRAKTPNGVLFYVNQVYRNANNAVSAD
ncbi:hypothetical protein LMG28688_06718 [Paraburkholderia caffeinitolerans]|uniref:Bacterial Ig domain-containing protein n=1 Tax=Paraburkholderia caffeinitolerans TaxID=1723730 RepID=A0A6J5H0A2_9BURK|nr:hypothetical protein [Paraburkholderia caffeinitolerans]CAB3808201.1 hypothetical protein LMG28688_06718 [Paraburkholderia caffeinitolerans]